MPSAQLVNLKGKTVGEVNLTDTVFGIEPNTQILFESLHRQLQNARMGSASTKTRSEVAGGGRKPWRQKGTGRARAGSIRSPLWAGGGVTFGPKPRDYSVCMPRKMRQLAIRSALAARVGSLVVVKDFADLKEAKTKEMAGVLKNLGIAGKPTLIVLDFACPTCTNVERAARNIDRLKVVHMNNLSVKDLLHCEALLTTESTIQAINARFKKDVAEPAAKVEKDVPSETKKSVSKMANNVQANAKPKSATKNPAGQAVGKPKTRKASQSTRKDPE